MYVYIRLRAVTAWSNLESVAEDMTLTDLQRALDVEKAKMFSTDPPSEGKQGYNKAT